MIAAAPLVLTLTAIAIAVWIEKLKRQSFGARPGECKEKPDDQSGKSEFSRLTRCSSLGAVNETTAL